MTPEAAYQHALKTNNYIADPVQAEAVKLTQALYEQLLEHPKPELRDKLWHSVYDFILETVLRKAPRPTVKGLYLWGDVGRGKTWLIDDFFYSLPFEHKQRIHFHAFMQQIHAQLSQLPKTPDPLTVIARELALKYRVICIDEFHVQDITDAMLLGGLLKALYHYGATLVTTSNCAPDELYKNGLQRTRFVPAIGLIKQYSHVFELNHATDFRSLLLAKEGCYHWPLNRHSQDMMLQHFIQLTEHAPVCSQTIKINQRAIETLALNQASAEHPNNVIWLDFNELCNTPRSNADYLYLAEHFQYLLIANIYSMDEEKDAVAKRFIHLIDNLYDHRCFVIISAETEPEALYSGRRVREEFKRTASRLNEMRSKLYRGNVSI
jgi:cell division protein ZapE